MVVCCIIPVRCRRSDGVMYVGVDIEHQHQSLHSFLIIHHDRFRVDIYSAHVLISITFAVFEYLDRRWQRKIKFLDFEGLFYPIKQEAQM